jgi:hypothetical protein
VDNPYAPPLPVAGAEDLTRRAANYLNLPWPFAVLGGLGSSVLSGVCVLLYQSARYLFDWPRNHTTLTWTIVLEAASFSSAVLFTVLVFTASRREGHGRRFGVALLCGLAGLVLFAAAVLALEFSKHFALAVFLILFPASQMLTAATICWIHHVPVRPPRLLLAGLLGTGAWFLLTMAAIWLIIQPLSYPWDDFTGFTLLTMFWCWVVALQMPLILNQKLRHAAEL